MALPANLKTVVKHTAAEATQAAHEHVAKTLREAVEQRGQAYLALAGGTTPHALYQLLARTASTDEVPWPEVNVFFGDERDVPQDHVESNYNMAQRALLDHVPVKPEHVHPMPASASDIQAAAAEYESTVRRTVPDEANIPRFDLVLLGMGGDGHTASLFPDTEVLQENEKLVRAYFVPVLGRNRMTFTYPLINASRNVVFLVTGEDKAEATAAVLSQDEATRASKPAGRVVPAGELVFIVDIAAVRLTDFRP